jgi:hypothetical protein
MGLMSDDDRRPVGPDRGEGVARRVGNAEREAAVALLEEHWRAGRLDPGEHELRVTRARAAVTQSDLDDLFTDLPRAVTTEPTEPEATRGAGGFLESKRETIMALTPFAATALFFTTGYNWLWFLMVPVMGILLYGPNGAKSPNRQRRGRDA